MFGSDGHSYMKLLKFTNMCWFMNCMCLQYFITIGNNGFEYLSNCSID